MSLEQEIDEEESKGLLKEEEDNSEENDEDDEDTDEEEQESGKSDGFYVLEVDEDDPLPAYDKFIHGVSPTSYSVPIKGLDYNRLFSYLGTRKTRNLFEGIDFEEAGGAILPESENNIVVSAETIERGIKAVKYFTPGFEMMDPVVPYEGMDPDEFEKYKLWRKMNPHLVRMFMEVL